MSDASTKAKSISLATFSLVVLLILVSFSIPNEALAKRSNKYARDRIVSEEIEQARAERIEKKRLAKEAAKKNENKTIIHTALDRRYRFAKKYQSEITIYGGSYLGDEWHGTWDVGGGYNFYFNNWLGVGVQYIYSPIITDNSSTFGRSLRTRNTHILAGYASYINDCAFRAGKDIIECDLYLNIGGGSININRQWKPMALIGGGLKIYTPIPWFSAKFEVNTYMHPTPNPTGSTFDADLAFNLGFSFMFPVKKVKPEEVPIESEEP